MTSNSKTKILLAFLILTVSFIYGLPHLVMIKKLGKEYDPIAITNLASIPSDKGFAYSPYVNQIIKGGFFLKEAYTFEYRNFPTPYVGETFSSNLLAKLSSTTGSIQNAFLATDFIMPPIIFLILYLISKVFIKDSFFAASTAFLTTILRDLILVLPYPKATYEYIFAQANQQQFLHYSRAFHPQITFPLFALSLLLLFKLVSKPDTNKALLLGVLVGISFYAYLFYWTFLVFFLSTLSIVFLIKREYRIAFLILSALGLSFVIGSFYFYNIHKFYSLEFAQDFTEKMTGPSIPFNPMVFRFLLIPIIFGVMFKKYTRTKISFITLFVSGVLIILTSKFLVGRDLETLHYVRRVMIPLGTIACLSVLYIVVKGNNILKKTVSISLILLAIISGIKTQLTATNILAGQLTINHNRTDLFNWFKINTQKDSVIGTLDADLNKLISSKTNNYTYFPPTLRTITPTFEELERYIILSNLLGIDVQTQKKSLDKYLDYIYFAKVYITSSNREPIRKLAEDEIDKNKNGLWIKNFSKYKINYIVVSNLKNQDINPDINFLVPITSINNYIIFSVKTN